MAITKTIVFDTVTAISSQIDYNWRVNGTDAQGVSIDQWYPARVVINMTGVPSLGGGMTNPVTKEVLLGTPSNTPYTNQQIYNLVKSASGLPALAPGIQAAYNEAIGIAVS